jgi:hypothetical protein
MPPRHDIPEPPTSRLQSEIMKIRVAYIEEPPFASFARGHADLLQR